MNKILFLLLLFTSLSVRANGNSYTIGAATCGEIDPYHIGDACVLLLEKSSHQLGVVVDLDLVSEEFNESQDLVGRPVSLKHFDLQPLSPLQRRAVGNILPTGLSVYHATREEIEIH